MDVFDQDRDGLQAAEPLSNGNHARQGWERPVTKGRYVLTGPDGHRFLGRIWRPLPAGPGQPSLPVLGDRPRAILGLHSFGDSHAAFDLWGPWFARRGHVVAAFDQRGFGLVRPEARRWAGNERYIADVEFLARALAQCDWDFRRPLVLCGESMGAALSLIVAARGRVPLSAVIAAGPAVLADMPKELFWNVLAEGLAQLAPGLRYPLDRSQDPRLHPRAQSRYRHDPAILTAIRAETHAELVKLCYAASHSAALIEVPTLVLYGEGDRMIHARSIAALKRALGSLGEVASLPEGPHLVLQMRERAQVERPIERFFRARLGQVAEAQPVSREAVPA